MSGSGSELNEDFAAVVHKIFNKLVKKLNIKENYKIDINTGAAKGDGYIAAIFTVTVTGENENNENITLNCLVKAAPQDEIIRKNLDYNEVFQAEANFYENIYPTMEQFQTKRNVKEPFNNIAKCYMSNLEERYEAIIFENLKTKGYDLWSKFEQMPKDHFELVLPIYGKYHAISFALRDQEPEVFNKLAGSIGNACKIAFANKDFAVFTKMASRTEPIRLLRNLGHDQVADAYSKACDEYDKWMSETVDEGDQSVIAHGDCWSNNMMFLNNENSKPEKVYLLDWQLQIVTTPVWDIGYFFFAAARGQILKDVNKYLKIYYESFAKFLRELGSNPDELFSYSDFMRHWKKYGHRSLIVAIFVLRLITQNAEDMPLFDDAESFTEYVFSENRTSQKHSERIVDIILTAYESGLL